MKKLGVIVNRDNLTCCLGKTSNDISSEATCNEIELKRDEREGQ